MKNQSFRHFTNRTWAGSTAAGMVNTGPMPNDRLSHLTEREKDCLRLVHRGMLSSEIARELSRPLDTVERQIKSARAKFGNQRRAAVARLLVEAERASGRPDQSLVDHPLALAPQAHPAPFDPGDRMAAGELELREERAVFLRPPPIAASSNEVEKRINDMGATLRILVIATIAIASAVITLLIIPSSDRAQRVGEVITQDQ